MRILKFLSPRWSRDLTMRGLARAVSTPLDPVANRIATLHRYLDPDEAPEDWLDWLMSLVSVPINQGLDPRYKRALIAHAMWAYDRKGSRPALERLILALTGEEATIVSEASHALICGMFVPGPDAIPGPGTQALKTTITLPTPTAGPDEQTLLDLLSPWLCDTEEVTLVYT